MSSTGQTICEKLRERIGAASLSQSVAVRRSWMPQGAMEPGSYESAPEVTIYQAGRALASENRSVNSVSHQISIAIHRRVQHATDNPQQLDEIDDLVELAQEISDLLHSDPIDVASVVWQETAHEPLCDYQMLTESQVFLSVITITYREYRSR
jgi:hypothetical protein